MFRERPHMSAQLPCVLPPLLLFLLLFLLLALSSVASAASVSAASYEPCSVTPPKPVREFRAAWVATVGNIDWPSQKGLSTADQKAELLAILDRAVQLKLNAIIFQVRPACDALYASQIERLIPIAPAQLSAIHPPPPITSPRPAPNWSANTENLSGSIPAKKRCRTTRSASSWMSSGATT